VAQIESSFKKTNELFHISPQEHNWDTGSEGFEFVGSSGI